MKTDWIYQPRHTDLMMTGFVLNTLRQQCSQYSNNCRQLSSFDTVYSPQTSSEKSSMSKINAQMKKPFAGYQQTALTFMMVVEHGTEPASAFRAR